MAACDPAPVPPSTSPIATPTPSPTPAPTPSPTPTPVPSLTIAIDGALAGGLSDAARGADAVRASGFIHDGLFGLDERLRPVPVLADGPATVSADGRSWTIRLRDDVRFADGSPLIADDVVRIYELARSTRCPFRPSSCLSGVLERIVAADQRTVVFTLSEPLAAFATSHLGLGIERASAIDAAYASFLAGVDAVTASETADYLRTVAAEEADPSGPRDENDRATVDWGALRAPGEALLSRAGVVLPDAAAFGGEAELDEAAYVGDLVGRIRAVDASFTSRPIDALAAAYPYLDTASDPVTTGPFQLAGGAREPGGDIELVANEGYFLGAPAIERIVLRTVGSDAEAAAGLADGTIDWRPGLTPASRDALADDPDVQLATYPEFAFYGLTFNLHPDSDGLFIDRNLRQALALCFDHDAAVTAAVGDDGVAIDTEIPPMSWAYPAGGITDYRLDRERATALIEASGWELGSDGIYEKGGRRLATIIPVREGFPARTAWLQAVSDAVRACGIELEIADVSYTSILRMLAVYPHVNAAAPDSGDPYDAYFGGLDTGVDPDPYRLYHSTECTSSERTDTFNFGCYQDATVDRLIEAARVEPDLSARARLYAEYAARISEDLPVIYAWSDLLREGIAASVDTTAPGGLQLDTPTWYRSLERLTNVR